MESQSQPTSTILAPSRAVARCPFHDGPLTLDLLLGELGPEETDAIDAALDLRSAVAARADAENCLHLALRLRRVLDGTHYLAFYRLRLWLQRVIFVQVRGCRGDEWVTYILPLNSARMDEIENACRSAFVRARGEAANEWAQVRFVFRPNVAAPVTA